MPTDTKPLPAAQLMALADDAVVGTCQKCRRRVKMSSVTHDGGHKTCSGPVRFGPAGKAYRAARAASPVTLEELLVREMHEADEAISDAGSPRPDELTKRWNTVAAQLKRHARRLAGEGGA